VCLALSEEGPLLASVSDDGAIRLWDAHSEGHRPALEGSPPPSHALALSHDGRLLASASDDGTVRLWDVRSGTRLHALERYPNQHGAMGFSRDGALLATSSREGMLWLWDVRSGALLRVLEGHKTAVEALAFSPEGGLLASASSEGRLYLWNPRTGERLHTELMTVAHRVPGKHVSPPISLAFSPNGEVLTAMAHDGATSAWDVRTHALLSSKEGNRTDSALLAPDGQVFASASSAGMHLRAMHGARGAVHLSVVEDAWAASVQGTPFFIGGGELSRLLHFVWGDRTMPAQLWAPLFQRPELVRATLAGEAPDLATLGLDSYAACESALIAERTRRGLVRRRQVM
jgi:WD40 repeat protein